MMPWFIWNNENSAAYGLWISKLPRITRPKERYETVDIPGRAGSLILLEGDDVYESYTREITVTTVRNNARMQELLNWLRGEGELVVSNEPERVYKGRIASEVSFDRISNDMIQAKIAVFVEPFKRSRYTDKDTITLAMVHAASQSIINPGNVSSKPTVTITKTSAASNTTITIGDTGMEFRSLTGTIVVDCDAGMITNADRTEIWGGTFSGDFWQIQPGEVQILSNRDLTVQIKPGWRWV